jgi:hypothetical protein
MAFGHCSTCWLHFCELLFMNLTYMFYNFYIFCLPSQQPKNIFKNLILDEPDVPAPLLHHQAPQVVAQHTLSLPTPIAYTLLPWRNPETKVTADGCLSWDGILGHQFNKRLESFAPCYSQSLLLADFKKNHTLLWCWKSLQKKIRKTRKLESIHENYFVERKILVENQTKLESKKEFMPKNLD